MATFQQTAKWNEFMTKFAWRHKVKTHNIWHWFSRNSMKIPIQTAGGWEGFEILTCNLEWTHYRQEDGENYETKWSNNEFDDNGWATMRLPCKMDFFFSQNFEFDSKNVADCSKFHIVGWLILIFDHICGGVWCFWWCLLAGIYFISPRLGNPNRMNLLQLSLPQHFASINGLTLFSAHNTGFETGNSFSSSTHLWCRISVIPFHILQINRNNFHVNFRHNQKVRKN